MKMKMFQKKSIVTVIVAFFVFAILGLIAPNAALAVATAPALGSLKPFGIVSSTSTNANTGLQTIIKGSVCGGTLTVPRPLTITGGAEETPCAAAKGTDQTAALGIINGQACTPLDPGVDVALNNVAGHLTGHYTPGCYSTTQPGAASMTITTGTTVTLDGGGDPNAVFIFRAAGALKPAANTNVVLTNGANANNVFWAPVEATTIGANSAFVGNIIDAAGITLGHFSTLLGRALAFGETVTTDANTITVPTSLTLVKTVDNTGGGGEAVGAWTLSTVAPSPTIILGHTTDATVTNAAVEPGDYTLSEDGPAGYTAGTYSCVINGGIPAVSNSVSLLAGDNAICTIRNTYNVPVVAPILNLVKIIAGGATPAELAAFTLRANGTGANDFSGTSPVTSGAGLLADTFALTETGPGGYTASAWGCVTTGAPAVGNSITLANGDVATCTITNTRITPPSSPGYTPPVPPLIDVVKVPSPLALPGGPGVVNYGYTLTNIGTVPVTDITMVDNSCSPLTLTSGDSNSDSILGLTETWIYHCSTTLSATHTNTVTATGWANGVSAVDLASATVVVGAPIVPPLIHITKVPSPLTLGAGGGMVTYTKRVTNPGTVALSNVHVTDSKCSPINYISGDTNSNSMLEPSETWTYTCQTNLTTTTTNTAIATGTANGLTATDFAIATVVVASAVAYTIPTLPNTGVAPITGMVLLGIAVIVAFFLSAYFIRKKQTKN